MSVAASPPAGGANLTSGTEGDGFDVMDSASGGGLRADNRGAAQTIALKKVASNPALDAGEEDRLEKSELRIDTNGGGGDKDVIATAHPGGASQTAASARLLR